MNIQSIQQHVNNCLAMFDREEITDISEYFIEAGISDLTDQSEIALQVRDIL